MLENIKIKYSDIFSKNDAKIFDYLKKNRNKNITIKELANNNKLSKSAVVRFTKKIGYQGFKDFMAHYKYLNNESQTLLVNENNFLLTEANLSLIKTDKKNITTKALFVAKKIIEKNNVIFYGSSFNYILCQYYSRLLNKINIKSSFFNTSSDKSIIMPDDNAIHIFISTSGTDNNFIKIINKINTPKTITISITANTYSNINSYVNETINGTFLTNNEINPYELPIIPKYSIQYILDLIFINIYRSNKEKHDKIIDAIKKERVNK